MLTIIACIVCNECGSSFRDATSTLLARTYDACTPDADSGAKLLPCFLSSCLFTEVGKTS